MTDNGKGRFGLRAQHISVFIIAVVMLSAVFVAGEFLVPWLLVSRAADYNLETARLVSGRVTQALDENAKGLQSLAGLPDIVSMDPAQQAPVMNLAEQTNPEIREMFIVDNNGVAILAVPDHPSYTAGRNFGNADYYRQARDTGQPAVSDVFIEGNDIQTIVAAPIKQPDGQPAGTLNSVMSMTNGILARYFAALKIGENGYAVLVDKRGTLIWHPDQKRVLRQENFRRFDPFRNVVARETGTMTSDMDGRSQLVSYVSLTGTKWGLVIVRPMDEALPNLLIYRIGFAAVFALGLLLAWSFFWYGNVTVVRPLRTLTEGVEEVAAGNLDYRIEMKRPREFADFVAVFNNLVSITATYDRVSRALNSIADLDVMEDFVLSEVDKIIRAEATAIIRFDDAGKLVIHASRGYSPEMVDEHNRRRTDMGGMIYMFGADTVNKLKDGESVLVDSEKLTSLKSIAPNEGAKYFCLFPLRVENELEGTLLAVSSSESPFTSERIRTVSGLADQVAVAVHRSSLYERLYRSYAQTTKAIARAIDAKDPYNQGHSEGVAVIAVKIARSMGLSTDQVHGIEIAAYLHDVGKIGISEDILKKPAQLSEEERDQVRQHPAIGVTILGPIEFPWPVLPAVQSHHENYGGNGYPDKLAGEDIPLEARILAVADAYESMISDRPYRSALETEEIIKEFARESGRQFDARVVSALLDVIESEMVQKEEEAETEDGRQEIAFKVEVYRAETAEPDITSDKQAAAEPTADKPAEELLAGKVAKGKKPAGKKKSKHQKSKESS